VSISVKNVTKTFGSFVALDNVSLEVPGGELLALLGPSGSGKTTLLRIISGLEVPDRGSILYQEEDVTGTSVRERNVGFVFQHYALFRHMTVFDNIGFGLRVRKRAKAEIRERVLELLRLVQLEGYEHSMPSQLSGGQRQRVALARALAAEPKVLLLDEPFGALDAKVRQELRTWLRRLHDEIHVTSVFVTHDQEEAFEVADRVVIMSKGRIEQVGSPAEIFEHPANPFVMDFLGNVNVFHGSISGDRAAIDRLQVTLRPDGGDPSDAKAFVRSHELEIQHHRNGRPALQANVVHINPARPVVKVRLHAEEFGVWLNVDVSWERYADLRLKNGDMVFVTPRNVRVFTPDYQI
jgi:sulfate transport system ATP-binding protein